MPNDLFLIAVSITLLVLSVALIVLLALLIQSAKAQAEAVRELRRELLPALGEIRQIGQNLLTASEGLRTGLQGVNRLTDALGNIGDDLELGHQGVKGGIKMLGKLLGPWLAKLIG